MPLTRQFTIEYSALFDALLPALERLGLPVPLGGTSNHFVRKTLVDAGGWDPFNVTEDADLGIRFARMGHKIEILPSTTYEEAPPNWHSWKGQRTRWLKGWTQTFLVHLRQPTRSARDLGCWRLFGLLVLMGGLLLSAFVHPLFYIALALSALPGAPWIAQAPGPTTTILFYVGIFNLVTGYLAAITLGAAAIYRRGLKPLVIHTITMPIYWLLISFAAYRALLDLMRAPFYWEKTMHRGRSNAGSHPGPSSLTEPE